MISRRILLAEDTHVSALMMTAALEAAGHTVQVAEDGAQALSLAERGAFDVVLMDVNMPRLDGLEATRRIRALPDNRAALPIIGLTGEDDGAVQREALAAGMDTYLIKPAQKEELMQTIERVLRKRMKQSA